MINVMFKVVVNNKYDREKIVENSINTKRKKGKNNFKSKGSLINYVKVKSE